MHLAVPRIRLLRRKPCRVLRQPTAQHRDHLPLCGGGGGIARREHGLVLCVGWGVGVFPHGRDEAVAIAIDGLDELLSASAVADGLAHAFDRALQRRIADELLGPDLLAQLLLGDSAVVVRQQVGEGPENFPPRPDALAGPAQHMALRVEFILPEDVDHGESPPPRAGR
jgi:hypothetical protein